ncbi:unnamed protein product [Brachionus calyciflorus]|uniref:Uncharacterized protein n=1 Tax=Brachionus calyciflorus TaxID=104777 RepID=A0A813XBS9_9BILA|nr:unnamed protein product [Brachionus calyciflorus]
MFKNETQFGHLESFPVKLALKRECCKNQSENNRSTQVFSNSSKCLNLQVFDNLPRPRSSLQVDIIVNNQSNVDSSFMSDQRITLAGQVNQNKFIISE